MCSRQSGLPVFAVGNVPVAALARLLETLGAGEGGDTHIVVTGEPRGILCSCACRPAVVNCVAASLSACRRASGAQSVHQHTPNLHAALQPAYLPACMPACCCQLYLSADVREELVVYINGMPYIRRELEMPAAAMHHAGVHARQLEALEGALKEVRV